MCLTLCLQTKADVIRLILPFGLWAGVLAAVYICSAVTLSGVDGVLVNLKLLDRTLAQVRGGGGLRTVCVAFLRGADLPYCG